MSHRRQSVPDSPPQQESASGASGTAPSFEATADMIDYVADMISELQGISARLGCSTLSGILALALAEAKQQSIRASANRH